MVAAAARPQGPHRSRGLRRRPWRLSPLTARLVGRCARERLAERRHARGRHYQPFTSIPMDTTAKIRELNDALRTAFAGRGRIFIRFVGHGRRVVFASRAAFIDPSFNLTVKGYRRSRSPRRSFDQDQDQDQDKRLCHPISYVPLTLLARLSFFLGP